MADARKPIRLAWTIKELAQALNSNYHTIRREILAGKIDYFKIGAGEGEYRISVFEVARCIGVPVADLDQLLVDLNAREAVAS